MKKLLKKIHQLISFTIIYVGIYYAEFNNFLWCQRLVIFITLLSFLIFCVGNYNKEIKNKMAESYKKGYHLPLWVDHTGYWGIILFLIALGWWFTGICWFLIWALDITAREQALKIKSN